jgi:hypothetical protein
MHQAGHRALAFIFPPARGTLSGMPQKNPHLLRQESFIDRGRNDFLKF